MVQITDPKIRAIRREKIEQIGRLEDAILMHIQCDSCGYRINGIETVLGAEAYDLGWRHKNMDILCPNCAAH